MPSSRRTHVGHAAQTRELLGRLLDVDRSGPGTPVALLLTPILKSQNRLVVYSLLSSDLLLFQSFLLSLDFFFLSFVLLLDFGLDALIVNFHFFESFLLVFGQAAHQLPVLVRLVQCHDGFALVNRLHLFERCVLGSCDLLLGLLVAQRTHANGVPGQRLLTGAAAPLRICILTVCAGDGLWLRWWRLVPCRLENFEIASKRRLDVFRDLAFNRSYTLGRKLEVILVDHRLQQCQ